MTSCSKVLSTKFNFSYVLLTIKVFAYFHDSVKIFSFAINFYCFFVLISLNI
jgi:hypothetical protein